jgi:uncharacterized protein (DUF2062 family)
VPEIDPKLKTQRIVIIAAVILAMLFAGGNIIASLGTWQDNDATPQPPVTADPL